MPGGDGKFHLPDDLLVDGPTVVGVDVENMLVSWC
jgi:hypothetical protein